MGGVRELGSYRETIERAVGYGNDTDTTAAIAGGLAGIRWGLDEADGGIPAEWLEALRGTTSSRRSWAGSPDERSGPAEDIVAANAAPDHVRALALW